MITVTSNFHVLLHAWIKMNRVYVIWEIEEFAVKRRRNRQMSMISRRRAFAISAIGYQTAWLRSNVSSPNVFVNTWWKLRKGCIWTWLLRGAKNLSEVSQLEYSLSNLSRNYINCLRVYTVKQLGGINRISIFRILCRDAKFWYADGFF